MVRYGQELGRSRCHASGAPGADYHAGNKEGAPIYFKFDVAELLGGSAGRQVPEGAARLRAE